MHRGKFFASVRAAKTELEIETLLKRMQGVRYKNIYSLVRVLLP
jgi:hypothetical protein